MRWRAETQLLTHQSSTPSQHLINQESSLLKRFVQSQKSSVEKGPRKSKFLTQEAKDDGMAPIPSPEKVHINISNHPSYNILTTPRSIIRPHSVLLFSPHLRPPRSKLQNPPPSFRPAIRLQSQGHRSLQTHHHQLRHRRNRRRHRRCFNRSRFPQRLKTSL